MRPKIKTYQPGDVYSYAHLKRDGIWLELCGGQSAGKSAGCWTRHPTNLYDQLSHHPTVHNFFRLVADCNRVTLYCEMYVPGSPQSEVKSALASGRMGDLTIECFASPDLDPNERLYGVGVYSGRFAVPFNCEFAWVREPHMHDVLYHEFSEKPDSEGVVYKDGNLTNWAKRKREETTDLVIIGFTDGREGRTGKMIGKVGALELGLADGTFVCRCSGMDDAVRDQISANRDAYLGKVVEVTYQYVAARGGLRHPRFKQFRDDKRAEDCIEV